ncbi:MAG: class I SAM-dependent methyltransferase [Alphaproteobacteria bacterium]
MVAALKIQSPQAADLDYNLLKQLAYAYGDHSYADFVTQVPFDYYVQRVQELGFTGMDKVIDVGCGFGQWSAALALFNGNVVALERHEKRLGIAKALADHAGLSNVETCLSDALTLPYENNSVDAVFCYGVLMFVHRGKGLDEFYRVLKPGGKLYVCTNGFGWWLQTFFKYFFKNPNARRSAWNGMCDKNGERVPNCTNLKDVPAVLSQHGFDLVAAAAEGTICLLNDRKSALSAYQPKFLGFDNVIEYVAKKKGLETLPG